MPDAPRPQGEWEVWGFSLARRFVGYPESESACLSGEKKSHPEWHGQASLGPQRRQHLAHSCSGEEGWPASTGEPFPSWGKHPRCSGAFSAPTWHLAGAAQQQKPSPGSTQPAGASPLHLTLREIFFTLSLESNRQLTPEPFPIRHTLPERQHQCQERSNTGGSHETSVTTWLWMLRSAHALGSSWGNLGLQRPHIRGRPVCPAILLVPQGATLHQPERRRFGWWASTGPSMHCSLLTPLHAGTRRPTPLCKSLHWNLCLD